MVLESLISPLKAEKRPWEMFFVGILYSTIAIFISIQIFESMAGLISVFLTVIACIPLMYNTLKLEEEKDKLDLREKTLLKEHSKAISFIGFLFLGMVFSYTTWYVFLPKVVTVNLFSIQIDTIKNINSNIIAGSIPKYDIFAKIFLNNMKVLIFCILFSFFYGAGAIFIITWNASVVSVAIGNYIKNALSKLTTVGLAKVGGYFSTVSMGVFRYMTHGILEMLAYFIAGVAGGIISVAVINHDFGSKSFEKIVLDSAGLLLVSIIVLFMAGLIEVYITPTLF